MRQLEKLAQRNHTRVHDELRRAVEAYLADRPSYRSAVSKGEEQLSPEALEQLDDASAQILQDVDQTLARMIARHERVFAWLDGRGPKPCEAAIRSAEVQHSYQTQER